MAQTDLNITVSRVLYPPAMNPGNWYVLLTDMGKCCGSMTWRPEMGERLTLSGKWGAYRGERNFQFVSAIPNMPSDPRDMLRYVCERAAGIGPAIEDAIWATYGADWQEIQAGGVPRLTGTKYESFCNARDLLKTEKEKSEAIGWLMGKGCTAHMAMSAWEKWEKETVGVVRGNCYRLADLPHFGFVHVDGTIRTYFGIADDDKRRVEAAIIYAMKRITDSGSTVANWTDLRDEACKLIGHAHMTSIVETTGEMFRDGGLKAFPDSQSIALMQDYNNESLIWEWINEYGQRAHSV